MAWRLAGNLAVRDTLCWRYGKLLRAALLSIKTSEGPVLTSRYARVVYASALGLARFGHYGLAQSARSGHRLQGVLDDSISGCSLHRQHQLAEVRGFFHAGQNFAGLGPGEAFGDRAQWARAMALFISSKSLREPT